MLNRWVCFGSKVDPLLLAALKRVPKFSVAVYLTTQHYKRDGDRKRHEAGLLLGGLPV